MESFGRIFDIAGMIVVLAIITTLVAHAETKRIISAIGDAFSGSLRVAMGN
jgi:uncharacterized membrane protein